MFFSDMTKNLNREIATKNLVTFKMKSFDIMGVHLKIRIHSLCLKQYFWEGGGR